MEQRKGTNMSYINKYSWKCLLGKQSKNIQEGNEIYLWDVGKRKHFCCTRPLTITDLPLFAEEINFHYLSIENCEFLKTHKKITRSKNIATTIDLTALSLVGNANKSLRHSINRGNSYNLTVESNYRDIKDVEIMINEWSEVLAEKYFRDNSGKNLHLYKNNYHLNCHNVFLYDGEALVSFGSASPNLNDTSSYILGKALCNRYYGLSEFTDYLLYQKCLLDGIKIIDLGQTTGGMTFYKNKFPGAGTYEYYNGKIL